MPTMSYAPKKHFLKANERKPLAKNDKRLPTKNSRPQQNTMTRMVQLGVAPFKPVKKVQTSTSKHPRTVKVSYLKRGPTDSWGAVANWYDKHLSEENNNHKQVLLPNLLRLISPKRGESIVDLACGTGFFSSALAKEGAQVTGIDVSEELIAIARKNNPSISFHVSSAEKFSIVADNTKDKVLIVLAVQNIEHTAKVFTEAMRVLVPGGTLHIVMNHPAFRIPKLSSWAYDEKKKVQYRRIDEYLSESKSVIDMHPGKPNSAQTISYHRPLQYYFKILQKAGFTIERLEEWTSTRTSDSGPRAGAENNARKEFPLFVYLSAKKI